MPRELDSCVRQVKRKGKANNPHAVCRASLGTDANIAARRRSTQGSAPFTEAELSQGYRRISHG